MALAPLPSPPIRFNHARTAWLDNLKVVLVAGVIVGHATMAWTGVGNWVFEEPPVREPLLSLLVVLSVIGASFAMPLFFLVAGALTPSSLERKGPARFLRHRTIRLGIPVVFYVVLLSPFIEYADPGAAGWERGFLAYAWHIWWPPAWGPTWFLVVLLAFSGVYTGLRTIVPKRERERQPSPPGVWQLVALVAAWRWRPTSCGSRSR